MHPIEVTVPRLHNNNVDAITLWPFILYRRGHEDNPPLRCHEYYHWRQALRWGVLPWYLIYVILVPFYLGKRAERHPLEAPAYAKQREIIARLVAGQDIDQQRAELGLV